MNRTLLLSALLFPALLLFAQDESVNPGINDSFADPEPKSFVERFEREGREVYDNRETIVTQLDLKPGMVVADVGAGTGLFTRLIAPKVGPEGKVYAVDIAKNFVTHTVLSSRARGLKQVEGIVCTQDDAKLPAESIDVVFICDTFHHFEYPIKTMRSIRRALKPGGKVYLLDFERIEGVSSDWILGHVRAGKEVFQSEVEQSGFELEEEFDLFEENYFLKFRRRWNRAMPRSIPLLFLFGLLSISSAAFTAPAHPNIVYILADDLGTGDISCYNEASKIQTPHVDRMAAEGMRFTDAHTPSAVCTPTRYGILTGRYSWRTRLKYRVLDGFDPPLIDQQRVTVPSLLQNAGYDTHCVGKWHLGMQWTGLDGHPIPAVPIDRKTPPRSGREVDYTKPVKGGPTAVGFDSFFGISASLNMSPFCYLVNDKPYRLPVLEQKRIRTDFITVDEGVRSPDFSIYGVMPRFAGEAVAVIEKQASEHPDRPFFLYAPLSSPHLPVVPNEEYRGTSEAGGYGDFVVETDAFVGAILEALDRTGLAENTLVIFTSDNGGLYHWWDPQEADDLAHYKVRSRGALMKEYGHQGNMHLRGTKADIWEGGHRVPFVARWPGKTTAGTVSEELIELTDLLQTCAAIVEANLPEDAGPDSRNMLPALLAAKPETPVRDYAVHHSLWGVFAIRQGPWKMIPHRGSGGFTFPKELDPEKVGGPLGQLYHLVDDPSETKNLWDEHPEIVEDLQTLLQKVQNADY